MPRVARLLPGLLAAGMALPAAAAIYSCTDASGRRITADRPIPECLDREQRQFDNSGTPRRTVPPTLSDTERAVQDDQARKAQAERDLQLQERSRLRALAARYPTPASLERERLKLINPVIDAIGAAQERLAVLDAQSERLASGALLAASGPQVQAAKQSLSQNEQERALQRRLLADKQAERARIDKRFEDMQRQLQPVWAGQPPAPTLTGR